MEMCFHGNQLSWGIKHPLISIWSKYRSLSFIRFSTMLAPVISSLDEINCSIFEIFLLALLAKRSSYRYNRHRVLYNIFIYYNMLIRNTYSNMWIWQFHSENWICFLNRRGACARWGCAVCIYAQWQRCDFLVWTKCRTFY